MNIWWFLMLEFFAQNAVFFVLFASHKLDEQIATVAGFTGVLFWPYALARYGIVRPTAKMMTNRQKKLAA